MILVGVPDAIVFVRGVPVFIIELKTTSGNVSYLGVMKRCKLGSTG
jgi:type I site-specific restriction-modification system R (restriction) subunit